MAARTPVGLTHAFPVELSSAVERHANSCLQGVICGPSQVGCPPLWCSRLLEGMRGVWMRVARRTWGAHASRVFISASRRNGNCAGQVQPPETNQPSPKAVSGGTPDTRRVCTHCNRAVCNVTPSHLSLAEDSLLKSETSNLKLPPPAPSSKNRLKLRPLRPITGLSNKNFHRFDPRVLQPIRGLRHP